MSRRPDAGPPEPSTDPETEAAPSSAPETGSARPSDAGPAAGSASEPVREAAAASGPGTVLRRVLGLVAKGLALAALVGLAVWLNLYGSRIPGVETTVETWGFPGLFFLSALSGFNLVVPIPIILFFPFFTEIGMNPLATVIVIAVGMTTGDLAGYLLGSVGREIVTLRDGRILSALRRLRERRWLPYAVLLVYASVVPLPNELLVVPMAFLGFSLAGIFTATFLGNFVFNGLMAAGLLGLFGSS